MLIYYSEGQSHSGIVNFSLFWLSCLDSFIYLFTHRLRFTASGYPFGHCTVLSVRLRFTTSGYPFGHCTVLSVLLRFTASGYPFGHCEGQSHSGIVNFSLFWLSCLDSFIYLFTHIFFNYLFSPIL
jgi:hypothetical protein